MKNNGSEMFYTAINALIFCFSVTALVVMIGLLSDIMTTKANATRNRTTLYVVDQGAKTDETQVEVYTGRKEYSPAYGDVYSTPSTLGGPSYVIKAEDEIVTAAAVFTEMMSLPDTVYYVKLNGETIYASNIKDIVKKGTTYKLYNKVSAVGMNSTFRRIYDLDGSGRYYLEYIPN